MFKKCIQLIGIGLIISFSFYYTDKVVNIVRNQDPIMIKIHKYENSFNSKSVDAFIENDSIIPGINACVVDVNSSYFNMKKVGSYNSNMIEYKEIKPKLSIKDLYDKYIVKGNKTTNEVALIFKINNTRYINEILEILHNKSIQASFFVDGKLIEDDTSVIYNIINSKHEIYNYGYDGTYDKDLLLWTNNMIENLSYNSSKYCIVNSENSKVLDMCAKNKMYTIKSDLYISYSNPFIKIMNKIEKGSIIVFNGSDNIINELNKTILFLNSKGFKYNTLSNQLSEKGCTKSNQ